MFLCLCVFVPLCVYVVWVPSVARRGHLIPLGWSYKWWWCQHRPLIPGLGSRGRRKELCEFEISLVNRESSRTARVLLVSDLPSSDSCIHGVGRRQDQEVGGELVT